MTTEPAERWWWAAGGASTQLEGSAPGTDWRRWEEQGRVPPSGDGNGFATAYAEDVALLASVGCTHVRLSAEWARIQPRAGGVDGDALEHLRRQLAAGRDAGLATWLSLQAVTLPGWFVDEGGFTDERARGSHWPRYVALVAEELGDLVDAWTPVEDPIGFALRGWLTGRRPPGRRDPRAFGDAVRAVVLAGRDAWRELRGGGAPVVASWDVRSVRAADASPDANGAAGLVDEAVWRCVPAALRDGRLVTPGGGDHEVADLQGSADLVSVSWGGAVDIGPAATITPGARAGRADLTGRTPWPEALAEALERAADALGDLPIVAAGLGVATDDEGWRSSVLAEQVGAVVDAADSGVPVRGVALRAGVDGYEWGAGHVAAGLAGRDRVLRPVADWFADTTRTR